MNTFYTILLIVIFVLLVSDVYFLWKIYKNIGAKKKSFPDEKFFELKYNINLLKAVSEILIFLIGFLGFTTYGDILNNFENNFSQRFEVQNTKIDGLTHILSKYEKSVDSLKFSENESVENLDDINRKFQIISKKLNKNKETLKYTTKVFVTNNLVFKIKNDGNNIQRYWFSKMRTIDGDRLPVFDRPPLIITQAKGGMGFFIHEVTKDYVELGIQSVVQVINDKELLKPLHRFEM